MAKEANIISSGPGVEADEERSEMQESQRIRASHSGSDPPGRAQYLFWSWPRSIVRYILSSHTMAQDDYVRPFVVKEAGPSTRGVFPLVVDGILVP